MNDIPLKISDEAIVLPSDEELSSKSIFKLIPLYCLPLIIGSCVIGFQLVVDCVVLATGVSTEALATIGILFPYFLIMGALYDFMGPGGSAIITTEIGKGNFDKARQVCANSIIYCFVVCTIISILSYIFMDSVIWGLGATDALYDYAVTFLNIFLFFFPFITTGVVIYFFARAAGRPIISGLFNILPPILAMFIEYYVVFSLGFGIEASALSAIVALLPNILLIGIFLFGKGKNQMRLKAKDFKLDWGIIKTVSVIGFPSASLQLFYAVVMAVAANILAILGATLEQYSTYSIIDAYIYYFLTFIVFGFGLGIQPIISYNYTKSLERALKTLKITYIAGFITLAILAIILYVFMDSIVGVLATLNDTEGYNDYLAMAIGLYIWGIPILTITTTSVFFLQAIQKPLPAMAIIATRAFVFTIPALFVLTNIMGINGIWLAFPIAEVLSAIFAIIIMRRQLVKMKAIAKNNGTY